MGKASWSAMVTASSKTGATNGKPVWPILSAVHAACHNDAIPTSQPAASPPSRNCSAWATWPTSPHRVGSGRRGMRALVASWIATSSAQMMLGAWSGAGRGRWPRCGSFCVNRASNPPTIMLSAAYALASCGARPLTVPTVTPAIVGWSVPYRCAKPVASSANRPLVSWSMPSRASFKAVNPISPGSTEKLDTLFHSPCRRVPHPGGGR
jgi:hypothetical protein